MSKSIIIDPGHGGTDPGASGHGIREKDWALEISLYQYKRLKELGAKVGITRTSDKTLDSGPRTNLIKGKYDLCISNHWNAFNGKARGIETIHSIYGGKTFAIKLANALVKATGLPLRRVFTRRGKSGDYYFMHRMTGSTITVIIEYGFIDNKQDNDWFKNKDNFYKAAEAVIEVVCQQVGVKYVAPDGKVTVPPSKPSKPKLAPSKPKTDVISGAKLVKHENGRFTVTTPSGIKVRTAPSTRARQTGILKTGNQINYDAVYEGNGYRWLRYKGASGNTLYVPYRPSNNVNNQWGTFGGSKPVTKSKPKPKPRTRKLHLPASAKAWRIYNVNGPYTKAHAIHQLTPSAFGGITYDILEDKGNHVYIINTGVKGRVAIYAHPSTGARIT